MKALSRFMLVGVAGLALACGDGGGIASPTDPPGDNGNGDGGGDPGDGGTVPASASLAITWEQPERGGGVVGGGARGIFERVLPAAVRSLRIVYTRADGQECCVSIDPRSEVFPDPSARSLVLDALPPGQGVMAVEGFAVDVAPSAGIDGVCSVAPRAAARACDGRVDEAPSYGVPPFAVTIAGGSNDLGAIEIPALPFPIGRIPASGGVLQTPGRIAMAVVDAAGSVDPASVAIEVDRGDGFVALTLDTVEPCSDRDAQSPDCSPGGELEVAGVLVSSERLVAGTGDLRIRVLAANDDVPAATVDIVHEARTVPRDVDITFRLDDEVLVGSLGFDIDYADADGEFAGRSDNVECESLVAADLSVYNDIDAARAVLVRFADNDGIQGPADLTRCRFRNFQVFPEPADFRLRVVDATDPAARDIVPEPTVSIAAIEVVD